MKFHYFDVAGDRVINGSRYDVVMYRDFLQHLSVQNAEKAMNNARDGKVKFMIVSTFPQSQETAQKGLTPSWKNNVALAPFNLQNPLEDCCNHDDECESRLQLFKLT